MDIREKSEEENNLTRLKVFYKICTVKYSESNLPKKSIWQLRMELKDVMPSYIERCHVFFLTINIIITFDVSLR